MGASLIDNTVMSSEPVSCNAPPLPLLPRSLTVNVTRSLPKKSASGRYCRPSSAALMADRLPVNCRLVSLLPSPETKDSPLVLARLRLPCRADRLSCRAATRCYDSLNVFRSWAKIDLPVRFAYHQNNS